MHPKFLFSIFDYFQKENDIYFLFPSLRFSVCSQLYALGRGGYICNASVNCPQELLFILHPLVCIHYQIPIIVGFPILDIPAFCYSCHIALYLIVWLLPFRNWCKGSYYFLISKLFLQEITKKIKFQKKIKIYLEL